MDQTPDSTPEKQNPAPAPVKRPPSRLQRIIEHALSFTILIPAVASFFAFLMTMVLLIPGHGAANGVVAAFAVSTNYLISGYLIGGVPALLVGLLAYPLWRQFGEGWQLYVVAALFTATLCAATSIFFVSLSIGGIAIIAAFAAAATLAAVFLTRKLRM